MPRLAMTVRDIRRELSQYIPNNFESMRVVNNPDRASQIDIYLGSSVACPGLTHNQLSVLMDTFGTDDVTVTQLGRLGDEDDPVPHYVTLIAVRPDSSAPPARY